MIRNLRREARWLAVIGVIVAVALAAAAYLLSNQRLTSPFAERYTLFAELADASAVRPGLGAPVNVAGVKVGQIGGVELQDGRAVLELRLDPGEAPPVHRGARALLVPATPLNDMQVDLAPGDPAAPPLPEGARIGIGATRSPVDSDELLRALDADTRDYLALLIADVGVGLDGRGPDLRRLLRSSGPTLRQVRRISGLLASRRRALPRLVHNLSALAGRVGDEDPAIRRVVTAGNATLGALASQDAALRSGLAQLPETLRTARGALRDAAPFARELRRTLLAVEPAVPRLRRTLVDLPDTARGLLPLPVPALRRFTRAIAPLGRELRPASRDLEEALAPLGRALNVLTETVNILGYEPEGEDRSYLFWLGWFAHNANSMLSTQDAHGAVWRGLALFSCASFAQPGPPAQALAAVLGTGAPCP